MTANCRMARRLICTMRTRTGRALRSRPPRAARAAALSAAAPPGCHTPIPGMPAHQFNTGHAKKGSDVGNAKTQAWEMIPDACEPLSH